MIEDWRFNPEVSGTQDKEGEVTPSVAGKGWALPPE
jgi:hypothetical protein